MSVDVAIQGDMCTTSCHSQEGHEYDTLGLPNVDHLGPGLRRSQVSSVSSSGSRVCETLDIRPDCYGLSVPGGCPYPTADQAEHTLTGHFITLNSIERRQTPTW